MTDHEPTALYMRCGHDRCPFIGKMPVQQISPGCRASDKGPAEPPSFAARCPRCHWERDVDDDFKPCDHCGIEDVPELLMNIDGDLLCVWCRMNEWERNIDRMAKRLEVAS